MLLDINKGSACVLKRHSMQCALHGRVDLDAVIQPLSGGEI
jgi:hypothetical protein